MHVFFALSLLAADADLILHNGKLLTVDSKFSIVQAVAVKGSRIVRTGTSAEVLRLERSAGTRVVDLGGKTVVPGLIDSHVHTLGAGLSEFRDPMPRFKSVGDIQDYLRERAKVVPKGEWILVPRTFATRLTEMRVPNRHDLDVVPDHPVFLDSSYVSVLNTLGLKVCNITRETPDPPAGQVVKDANGEPNGILRNTPTLTRASEKAQVFTHEEKLRAMREMLQRYQDAGLTGIGDRAVVAEDVQLYRELEQKQELPVRVVMTWRLNAAQPVEDAVREIRETHRDWKTNAGSEWLKFGAFKVTLDGGMIQGTAYQRMPYGAFGKQLYAQNDPDSRGALFIQAPKLYAILEAAVEQGWQLTAHSQGGGAVDNLLDAFEKLNARKSIAASRSHVMHASFQNKEAIQRARKLGVLADVQPAWLYYDAPALEKVFPSKPGPMRYFIPLKSYLDAGVRIAGGSDHMIGFDKNAAINPYNPFLGMWTAVTRKTRFGEVVGPEERISRAEALRMYTESAAYLQFAEKERGTIEAGKLADLVVLDRDYLTCPEDEIRRIEPAAMYLGGREIARRK
jgi:predicted amidohydrolase YtcJ